MLKQSPSRGHKSKGIKVKHVLQICVLLAVCFWLIYQVKHSQEKRREFDAKDEKVIDKAQVDGVILRFGRKDLPRVTEIVTGGDKHGEDDDEKEDEEVEETKPDEEENKHEEDEPEREDGSILEREEERGGGDDETDEIELAKKEVEYEHGVEKVDEDKERDDDEEDVEENHAENEEKELQGKEEHFEVEENEDAENEDHNEKDLVSDDRDHDADTHGAREEQYKADDASSEVAQHVHNIIPKTENTTSGQANGMFGKVDPGQDNETKSFDNPDNLVKMKVEPREEVSSNLTSLTGKTPGLSDGVITASNANVSQNVIVEGKLGDKDSTLLRNVSGDSNKPKLAKAENQASGAPNKTENANTNGRESISSHNATMASQIGNDTDAAKPEKVNSATNEDHGVNLGENEAGGNDENTGDIQHDPIDESDNVTEEERESRVDLETLPDIQTEGQNDEETMAE